MEKARVIAVALSGAESLNTLTQREHNDAPKENAQARDEASAPTLQQSIHDPSSPRTSITEGQLNSEDEDNSLTIINVDSVARAISGKLTCGSKRPVQVLNTRCLSFPATSQIGQEQSHERPREEAEAPSVMKDELLRENASLKDVRESGEDMEALHSEIDFVPSKVDYEEVDLTNSPALEADCLEGCIFSTDFIT